MASRVVQHVCVLSNPAASGFSLRGVFCCKVSSQTLSLSLISENSVASLLVQILAMIFRSSSVSLLVFSLSRGISRMNIANNDACSCLHFAQMSIPIWRRTDKSMYKNKRVQYHARIILKMKCHSIIYKDAKRRRLYACTLLYFFS